MFGNEGIIKLEVNIKLYSVLIYVCLLLVGKILRYIKMGNNYFVVVSNYNFIRKV